MSAQGQLAFTAPRSHTSRKAAEAKSRGAQRGVKLQRLADAYMSAGKSGLTDVEASEIVMLPIQSVCSLRWALLERGWIGKSSAERMGAYRLKVSVWFWLGKT